MSDELTLDEIEAIENEKPKFVSKHKEMEDSKWPNTYREEFQIAVLEGRDEIEINGKKFRIIYRPHKSNYLIKPTEGFVPRAEVSLQWLRMNSL
jgi:hypothetical protein